MVITPLTGVNRLPLYAVLSVIYYHYCNNLSIYFYFEPCIINRAVSNFLEVLDIFMIFM